MPKITIAASAVLALATGAVACKDEANPNGDVCSSKVTGYSSPATGAVTLNGSFYSDESVGLTDASSGAIIAIGTPQANGSSFTLTGIPSGTHSYRVYVSCDGGTVSDAAQTFVVK